MKIGILTFHCAHNYGAVLQAYALQKQLSSIGHDVEIIDYRPQFLVNAHDVFELRKFKKCSPRQKLIHLLVFPITYGRKRLRHRRFDSFISSRLNLSKRLFTTALEMPTHYDAYIFGSDQIWNSEITDADDVFTGNFSANEEALFISYAASAEIPHLTDTASKALLRNFDHISVREADLQAHLQSSASKKINHVLDPSLLVSADIWDEISVAPKPHKKYVLVYQVRYDSNVLRIANAMAKANGWEVVSLTCRVHPGYRKNRYQCASVEEFVGYFKNASCVITTSFHGTAFSVIFNKPFYTMVFGGGGDKRSMDLLALLGLTHRTIKRDSAPVFSDIDYQEANCVLSESRKKSLAFLVGALAAGKRAK